jgi:hypothetical protein
MGAVRDALRRWLLTDHERVAPPQDFARWVFDEKTGVSALRQNVNNHENRIKSLEHFSQGVMEMEGRMLSRCLRRIESSMPKPKNRRKPTPASRPKK